MSKWPGKTKHAPDCLSVQGGVRQGDGTAPCTCGLQLTNQQRRMEILALAKQFDNPADAILALCAAIAVCATLSERVHNEKEMIEAMQEIGATQVALAVDCFRECSDQPSSGETLQ